jgi:SAM-dependent methyltransferase
MFKKTIDYKKLPKSDEYLKSCLNFNPPHKRYTEKQNMPGRDPKETDRGGWRGYDRVYSKYLSDKREDNIDLLEIGIYDGFGLLAWSRYFLNSNVYGIDIDISEKHMLHIQSIKERFLEYKRVSIDIADSTDQNSWLKFYNKQFDIIIDDGDHHPNSQIATLNCAWNYLKPGGLYFIEDISHRHGEKFLEDLGNKLKDMSKENKITIYHHQNEGLQYILNSEKLRKRYKIRRQSNFSCKEYIAVIQKGVSGNE